MVGCRDDSGTGCASETASDAAQRSIQEYRQHIPDAPRRFLLLLTTPYSPSRSLSGACVLHIQARWSPSLRLFLLFLFFLSSAAPLTGLHCVSEPPGCIVCPAGQARRRSSSGRRGLLCSALCRRRERVCCTQSCQRVARETIETV